MEVLDGELEVVNREKGKLEAQLATNSREKEQEAGASNRRFQDIEMKRQELQIQNVQLLGQLVIKAENNGAEPLDREVAKAFRKLRELISNIVQRHYMTESKWEGGSMSNSQKAFLGRLSETPKPMRIFCIRAEMFELLYEKVLGVSSSRLEREKERSLGDFKEALERCEKGTWPAFHQWQKRTVECTD
ncbi:hypothetical protein MMC30_002063 [Trapelia coarctata]|nr:hypothetical protein [Trapelia coarctata]